MSCNSIGASAPELYVQIHHRIVAALSSCLDVDAVMSIDEMMLRLEGDHRSEAAASGIAADIKAALRRELGEFMRCSIGVGPNRLLAKMAADMMKPDGFTVIHAETLPDRLYNLKLQDFVGIGSNMERRFWKYGITTVEQMYRMTVEQMFRVWESKLMGRVWHGRIRGDEIPDAPIKKSSIGHSHVLPPETRNDDSARAILLCMTHKAAAHMRRDRYIAQSISISIDYMYASGSWNSRRRVVSTCDTHSLCWEVIEMWARRPAGKPLKVGVVLGDLIPVRSATRPLFDESREKEQISVAMDLINDKLGDHAVYLGGMFGAAKHDPMRISFTMIPELRRTHKSVDLT
ncbi:MAG: hypothetical protein QM811_16690 [Pirellulales bacterium]